MDNQYKSFDSLIKQHLPQDSTVTSVDLQQSFGSLCAIVKYTISEEYQQENSLTYRNRIMSIRLIQSDDDQGLPISSYADNGI